MRRAGVGGGGGMSQFQIGEVAVIKYTRHADYPVGMEITILDIRTNEEFGEHYVIDEWTDGTTVIATDINLRKKRPPDSQRKREEIGDWELCPWRPVSVPKEIA